MPRLRPSTGGFNLSKVGSRIYLCNSFAVALKAIHTLSLPAPTLAGEPSLQRYPAGCLPDGRHPVYFSQDMDKKIAPWWRRCAL